MSQTHFWAWMRAPWCPAGVLLLAVLAVFGQVISFGWVNLDDDVNVTANPFLNPVSGPHLARLWAGPYEDLYIPVAYSVFAAEMVASRGLSATNSAAPPDARVFHAVSIVLHMANVLLVWMLLRRALPGAAWAALAGAAVFAVHPLQVESVAWISEQRGLLAGGLSLAAMTLHLDAHAAGAAPWRRTWGEAAGLVLFVAALLAKPQAVVVPMMLLAIDVGVAARPWRAAAGRLIPWFVLAGLVAVATKGLQPAGCTEHVPLLERPIVAGDALFFYARQLVWPVHLGIDYGRTPTVVMDSWASLARAALAWTVVAAAVCAPRWAGGRLPVLLTVIALLPVLGFAPFLFQNFSTVADRYFYLAMPGVALGVARIVAGLAARCPPPAVAATTGAWLLLLAGCSFMQARTWRDAMSLNEHALRVNPESFLGACNLGAALLDLGAPAAAVPHLEAAVARGPRHVNARLSLGMALDKIGKLDAAAECYARVLELDARHAEAHNYLGVIHARQGRIDVAAEHFRAALASKPGYGDARHNLDRAMRFLSPAADQPPPGGQP